MKLTREQLAAAKQVGMTREEVVQALRVAAIPDEEFERLVESDDPPTIEQLEFIGRTWIFAEDLTGKINAALLARDIRRKMYDRISDRGSVGAKSFAEEMIPLYPNVEPSIVRAATQRAFRQLGRSAVRR